MVSSFKTVEQCVAHMHTLEAYKELTMKHSPPPLDLPEFCIQ